MHSTVLVKLTKTLHNSVYMVSELNTANAHSMAKSGSSSGTLPSSNASVDAPLITSTIPTSPQVVGTKLYGPNYLAWVA
jgi:hypothetical protein